MTVSFARFRFRLCTACTFSLGLIVFSVWTYSIRAEEKATVRYAQSCREFTAAIRNKPLYQLAASDLERLNACNAVVEQREPDQVGF